MLFLLVGDDIDIIVYLAVAQESSVNITPMHTVSTPLGEYKYEVGTKSVVGMAERLEHCVFTVYYSLA